MKMPINTELGLMLSTISIASTKISREISRKKRTRNRLPLLILRKLRNFTFSPLPWVWCHKEVMTPLSTFMHSKLVRNMQRHLARALSTARQAESTSRRIALERVEVLKSCRA
jgi:hypothetical protein